MDKTESAHQPHDKFFRRMLSDRLEVAKLLNQCFKFDNIITKDNIEMFNGKFVNKQFHIRESDVVYRMKDMNIFFLIEHQSTMDYSMPQRIAEYQIELIKLQNSDAYNRKDIVVPLIIPLVIYTSTRSEWKAVRKLSDIQPKIKGYKNTGLGGYKLLDINLLKMDELLHAELFTYRFLALEKAKNDNQLAEIFEYLLHTEKKRRNIELLKDIANYVHTEVLKKESIRKKLLEKEEGEENMNFITMLEESRDNYIKEGLQAGRKEGMQQGMEKGIKRGIQQGMREGILQAKIEVAKELLKQGSNIEYIRKITQLPKKEIEKLESELSKA